MLVPAIAAFKSATSSSALSRNAEVERVNSSTLSPLTSADTASIAFESEETSAASSAHSKRSGASKHGSSLRSWLASGPLSAPEPAVLSAR